MTETRAVDMAEVKRMHFAIAAATEKILSSGNPIEFYLAMRLQTAVDRAALKEMGVDEAILNGLDASWDRMYSARLHEIQGDSKK